MTKANNPLMSFLAQGRLGKLLSFKRSRSQNIVETSPYPPDAKSLAQLSWRHMYLKAVALWHALSAAEKFSWESDARRRHMTGYAWFMSQALKPNPGLYLPLQGGIMTGTLDMGSQHLHGLKGPVHATDGVRKKYADDHDLFIEHNDTPAAYAGQALKGVRVNAGANALEFAALVGGYTAGARVYHNAHQAIPHATATSLSFNTELYDTDLIHDNIVLNSRLTCKTAGKYLITGHIRYDANATGQRNCEVKLNGTTVIGRMIDANLPAASTYMLITTIYDLAITDFVELQTYQSSGAPLNVTSNSRYSPEFMMQRIG